MQDKLKPYTDNISSLNEQRLLSLINNMSDGVLAIDDSLNIAMFNASALNLLDRNIIKEKESLSKVLRLFNQKDELVDIDKLIYKIKFPTINRDLLIKYKDGSKINLYLSISPVKLAFGSKDQKGYILMLRDITKEKSLEEERDEFISVVSHELRTPVTVSEGAISNALYMLDKTSSQHEIEKALKEAHKQIINLSDLINDLSSLSRAERGKLTDKLVNLNISSLFKELNDEFKDQAMEKHLKLSFKVDPHLELVKTSKLYLNEIIENLISNSLKYTHAGFISVEAKHSTHGVTISVSDSGIGISHSDQAKVFNKFYRSEDFRTAQTKGTGLGLYVSSKLAKLIGAKIILESELNKGSVFKVILPTLS